MILMIAFGFLVASLFIALIRLILGPSLANRVIALDLASIITIGLISTYSVFAGEPVYIDEAIVLGVIGFLGTQGYAFYIIKRGLTWEKP